MSQARKLLIVFGNDSAVVQTWAISAQRSIDVDPEEAAFFDITVTGDANIPIAVEVNDETLYSSLRYTYSTDSYTLVPNYPQYFPKIDRHPNTGAEVHCTFAGFPADSLGFAVNSLEVKTRDMDTETAQLGGDDDEV